VSKLQETRDVKYVSDGYHTFDELYQHRILLYLNLAKFCGWKSFWKPHYPGWPVLFMETGMGQISYHFEDKYLPLVEKWCERRDEHVWDGHTSDDVLERLKALL